MADAPRFVVALSGSPIAGSNTDLLTEAVLEGARDAGAETLHIKARDVKAIPCQACGPDPTHGTGYCIYHDDMDDVYAALERATGILVASPVFFSGVSAQLKLVIDRCNCITPAIVTPEGKSAFKRLWPRTRRGAYLAVAGPTDEIEPSRLTARGFLSWVGGRLIETMEVRHDDLETGAAARDPKRIAEAKALGARLAEAPLVPGGSIQAGAAGTFDSTHPTKVKPGGAA